MTAVALYGVGECPVCADSGAVLCVRSRQSQKLVFFCPLCGVAWMEPPPRYELNEVLSLDELAPTGVELPSKEEIEAAGFTNLQELSADEWWSDLEPLLRASGNERG